MVQPKNISPLLRTLSNRNARTLNLTRQRQWMISQHLSSNVTFQSEAKRSSSTSSAAASGDNESGQCLVEMKSAVLTYPGSSTKLGPWDLSIYNPSRGGHALLGRNGSGKSLISNALVRNGGNGFLEAGHFATEQPWRSNSIARVSFESHEELLQKGGTVSKAIADGGNLTKAAQFLVVRFGMFPLLHRDVRTLSTGEIRKVLLVRALSNRPRLLILDNAFDGLDVPSREILKDLVSKTIQGFRVDILVQAVSAKAAAHTQVLLLTHREEEVVEEIETLSIIQPDGALQTFSKSDVQTAEAFSLALDHEVGAADTGECRRSYWLPGTREVATVWNGRTSHVVGGGPIVHASNLRVVRGGATLLQALDWTVRVGDRWLVAGRNGQGKSTLSRMLAKVEDGTAEDSFVVALPSVQHGVTADRLGVGWVSTELHMATARLSQTAAEVLGGMGSTDHSIAHVSSWLGLDYATLRAHQFSELSQGQQKLVLIGAAIASRPDILVLDEPCQGLDYVNRKLVLDLVDRLCQATSVSLIYITHHLDEIIPSVTHVLHLQNGTPVYNGRIDDYEPTNL
jgi:molybdate transport system ATP-binding protein